MEAEDSLVFAYVSILSILGLNNFTFGVKRVQSYS